MSTKIQNKAHMADTSYNVTLNAIQEQIKLEIELISKYCSQKDPMIEQMLERYSKNDIPSYNYESASERIQLMHSIIDHWFLEDPSLKENFEKALAKKSSVQKAPSTNKLLSTSYISKEIQKPRILQENLPLTETSFLTERKELGLPNKEPKSLDKNNILSSHTDIETWNLADEVMQFEAEIQKNISKTHQVKKSSLLQPASNGTKSLLDTKEQTPHLSLENSLSHLIDEIDHDQNLSKTVSRTPNETESMMKDLEDLKRQVGFQPYRLNAHLRFILYQIINEVTLIQDKENISHNISKLEKGDIKIKDSKIAESLNLALSKIA